MSLPQVNNETVRNLEVQPFVKDYVSGVRAYENEYYDEAVDRLEFSLKSFFDAEEQCRFYCEGPFDQGWSPEFTTAVSSKNQLIYFDVFFYFSVKSICIIIYIWI